MFWHRHEAERYYRWRKEFAILPKQIGPYRVWLESYEWRNLKTDERLPRRELDMFSRWYKEFRLRNGYTVRCEFSMYPSFASSVDKWWYLVDGDQHLVDAVWG